jgi:hypothetical protein
VNKKKQKNVMTALRALELEAPFSPPARPFQPTEVFCALFFKKALLAF